MAVNVASLLQTLVQQKGSDLHIAANSPPMMRIRGDMLKVEMPPLTAGDVEAVVTQITSAAQKMELSEHKSVDFSFKASGVGIFRVNVFNQRYGLSVVLRALTEHPPTLEDLKSPEICKTMCSFSNGLVLVTGPTGSGKSTTLAAMLNFINMTTRGHILTLEDPIEYQHESKMCMVNQRAMGTHFTSFASAMRAALREDPDVILVGEMRDPETIALAIKAAETGHLVFSTLHTNSAAKSIDRIIGVFPADEQPQIRTVLSETLRGIIAQKLVPSIDKKRRICFHDILVNNPAVSNLIREGKTFQIPSTMQTGRQEGMQLMDRAILEAVERGEVNGEEAWEVANDKSLFLKFAPKKAMGAPGGGTAPAGGTPPGGAAAPGSAPGAAPAGGMKKAS